MDGVTDLATAVRRKALADMEFHWTSDDGHAAYLFWYDEQWIAERTDNGRTLTAASPEELSIAVANDYTQSPVSRLVDPA